MVSSRVNSIRIMGASCLMLAVALVAALGMAAVAPDNAMAAGKTKMAVVTKVTTTWNDGSVNKTGVNYYSSGLQKTRNYSYTWDGETSKNSNSLVYDKKYRLKSMTQKDGKKTIGTYSFKWDNKGRVKSASWKAKGASKSTYTSKYYYNNKGQVRKTTTFMGASTFAYNSDGTLKKWIDDNDETGKTTYTYKYDNQGNPSKSYYNGNTDFIYKNTYKGGKLVKVKACYNDGSVAYTKTFKYKTVSVPKSLKKMVNTQQTSTMFEILPFAAAHK